MTLLSNPTRRRWLAWGALALVFLLVNLHRLSTAVLSERLTSAFTLTAAELGTLHASFFIVYAVIQIPTGVLVDRVGPRHVGTAGATVLSLGALAFVASGSYPVAMLSRTVIGLGSGVIFVSILRFTANWYRADEFATMTGLTSSVAGLGAILATTPLALAVAAYGWRPTVTTLAAVGFCGAAGIWLLARRSPADAGLDPIEGVPDQTAVTLGETTTYLRRLAGDLDQWLLSITFFASMGTILTLIGLWGVPYLVVIYELEVTTASYYTLLGSVGMLVGGPVVGRVSDRIGKRLLPMAVGLGLFALALSVIPVFGSPPLPVVAGAYFVSGFFIGASMLALTVVKEQYPPEASGVATATVNAAGFVGATVLPTVMGIALDTYRTGEVVAGTVVYTEFGYRVAFGVLTLAVAVGSLCSVVLLFRHR